MIKTDRLGFVCGSLMLVCAVCLMAQGLIDPAADNLYPAAMAACSSAALAFYLWRTRAFDDVPLSSLALLGFTVTAQLAALVSQSTQGVAFTRALRAPETTFAVLAMGHLVAIVSHFVYRHFTPLSGARDGLARWVLSPLGIHDVPTPIMLWAMGAIGFAAQAVGGGGGVAAKVLDATQFMAWLPFLILVFHRRFGPDYCNLSRQLPLVLVYALGIVALGLARNARGLMFIGPVTALLVYLVMAVREAGPMPVRSFYRVLGALLVAVAGVVMVADLVTAMALARGARDGASRMEVIKETFEVLMDRGRIEAHREQAVLGAVTKRYDEFYLGNPLMSRLTETKFHDNMIYFGQDFDDNQRLELLREQGIRIVTLAPQPLLDALRVEVDKFDHYYSTGDVYLNLAYGAPMGGYATGSVWADVYVLGGAFWPFLLAVLLLPTFILLDSLARFEAGYFIAPVALGVAWSIFIYGVGGESMAIKVGFLLRSLPQKVLLYALVYWALSLVLQQRPFKPMPSGLATAGSGPWA